MSKTKNSYNRREYKNFFFTEIFGNIKRKKKKTILNNLTMFLRFSFICQHLMFSTWHLVKTRGESTEEKLIFNKNIFRFNDYYFYRQQKSYKQAENNDNFHPIWAFGYAPVPKDENSHTVEIESKTRSSKLMEVKLLYRLFARHIKSIYDISRLFDYITFIRRASNSQ